MEPDVYVPLLEETSTTSSNLSLYADLDKTTLTTGLLFTESPFDLLKPRAPNSATWAWQFQVTVNGELWNPNILPTASFNI